MQCDILRTNEQKRLNVQRDGENILSQIKKRMIRQVGN